MIDLRSDTVTRPSSEMRAVMATAEVGDDYYGEDPSVNRMQERVAEVLGKEAALWLPSGTMANQVALRVLTRPGDDVIVSRSAHTVRHETGGAAANAGVQCTEIGADGVFSVEEFVAAHKPAGSLVAPATTLVEIENTHNMAGGVVFPPQEAQRICEAAHQRGIASFLDGARIWNAAVALGLPPAALAAPFQMVSVAFSKGLGAPSGSALAGSRDLIARSIRHRRMLGGGMRQAGIFAAGCLYALDRNYDRLAEDHHNARRIAQKLLQSRRIVLNPDSVQTNILVFDLAPDAPDAASIVQSAQKNGVLLLAFGPRTLRVVTHLDVSTQECDQAAEIILNLIG